MVKPLFILASASPRRLTLLQECGVVPDRVEVSDIDESALPQETPRQLAVRLAYEKGTVIAARHPQALVLSADTVVACGRRVLAKAENEGDVRRCLSLLQGRRHHVYTAVALFVPEGKAMQRLADSIVTFERLRPQEIEAYVACGEGIGKAGGYAIQGRAAMFARHISGSYSGIVGLPMYDVAQLLKRAGYSL